MPFTIRPYRRFPVCCQMTYHHGDFEGRGKIGKNRLKEPMTNINRIVKLAVFLCAVVLAGCQSIVVPCSDPRDSCYEHKEQRMYRGIQQYNIIAPNNEYSISSGEPRYRVWYGTNRKPLDENNPWIGFSNSRDQVIHYGTAYVFVPKSHQFGSVGSWWITRMVTLNDDRLRIRDIERLNEANFIRRMRDSLAAKNAGTRKALVYIHGYNVTFDEAIIRAAQIGFDLKVEGITAVYSWPSQGAFLGYSADEATVESSAEHVKEFLARIALETDAEEVNVIAHSMGNRAFLRAVTSLAPVMRKAGKKFGQIILAAPDVDVELFKQLASVYPNISTRTTMYVSSKDLAIKTSELLHRYYRVGLYPPITTIPGIDTIQVSKVDLTLLGHSYFANTEAVLRDMFELIRGNPAPKNRNRLFPHPSASNVEYWEIGP